MASGEGGDEGGGKGGGGGKEAFERERQRSFPLTRKVWEIIQPNSQTSRNQ